MPELSLNGVAVADTFAEAFPMKATAIVITADSIEWARQSAVTMTGFATSVIACGCEAGIDAEVASEATPDGRPGVRVLLFAVATKELENQLVRRVGQCVLTSPGSACYAGLDHGEPLKLGAALRFFGDGWQIAKLIGGKRYWRVPVMDGEFVCQHETRMTREAVGGGNLILLGRERAGLLQAAESAVRAMSEVPGVIMPFPGGLVRSGSKIGSKYKALVASTNHSFCPTLKGRVPTLLPEDAGSVLEIVVDGLDEAAVRAAMRAGLHAVCAADAEAGLIAVTAGNYGGKLGPHLFHLKDLLY
jgi:formylmethanofuran--tetrahydromethanopterin N-formyltransferase